MTAEIVQLPSEPAIGSMIQRLASCMADLAERQITLHCFDCGTRFQKRLGDKDWHICPSGHSVKP